MMATRVEREAIKNPGTVNRDTQDEQSTGSMTLEQKHAEHRVRGRSKCPRSILQGPRQSSHKEGIDESKS